MKRRKVTSALLVTALALGAGGAAASPLRSTTVELTADTPRAPGVVAPVSAMARVDVVANPPAGVVRTMQRAAQATSGELARAAQSLRALRANLGRDRAEIYAFTPNGRGVCLIHWQRAATCPVGRSSPTPGVIYLFTPGGPGYPGQPADLPATIAGIVADNVEGVSLTSNGQKIALPILNNAIFSEISRPSTTEPWQMKLVVVYKGGSSVAVTIPDPRTD